MTAIPALSENHGRNGLEFRYQWMAGIPKAKNPCVDQTGKYASENQHNKDVWFLAGSFGNTRTVVRKCTIPLGKSILFPVLLKQDSFANDTDLLTEEELVKRAIDATNRTKSLRVIVDGNSLDNIENYRVLTPVFDLTFPESNVYDVHPGTTRAVCDGYWIFLKPLGLGRHTILFRGETSLNNKTTLEIMKNTEIYASIRNVIELRSVFRVDVLYGIRIE